MSATTHFAVEQAFDGSFIESGVRVGAGEFVVFFLVVGSRSGGEHVVDSGSVHRLVTAGHDGIDVGFACHDGINISFAGMLRSFCRGCFRAGFLQCGVKHVVADGHQLIDVVLGNAARKLRAVQEMCIRTSVDRASRCFGFQLLDAPDVDHQVDAAFKIA